jgi:SAM-dependent methyltransferase
MSEAPARGLDVEALNDRLAREHPIDEYYANAPFLIRMIERSRLRIIRRFVGEVDDADVLEVGSGGGHVLRMFPTGRLTALDVSDVYLEGARRNLAGYDVRYVKGEIDKLELPPSAFDRVICTEVLEHVVDPNAVLASIARVLRPSGVAVITVPNDPLILRLKSVARRRPWRWLVRDKIDWGGDEFHLHRWTPAEFELLLGRHVRVVDRRCAPFRLLPLRACFRCVPLR